MFTKDNVKSLLNESIYTVTFKKVDGTIRTMRCTLKPEYIPEARSPSYEVNDVVTVWDMEENGWRRFIVDNILSMNKERETKLDLPYVVKDFHQSLVKQWLENANDQAEELDELFSRFTTALRNTNESVLYYMIFWNNGSSGAAESPQTQLYRRELERRGKPYDAKIAEIIEKEVEPYY